MAQATAHPDRRLISSEDVQGTMFRHRRRGHWRNRPPANRKGIWPRSLRGYELRRLSWVSAQSLPNPLVGAQV